MTYFVDADWLAGYVSRLSLVAAAALLVVDVACEELVYEYERPFDASTDPSD